MLKETEYRSGIDDSPLSQTEYEYLNEGGVLYRRVTAPARKTKEIHNDNLSRVAV